MTTLKMRIVALVAASSVLSLAGIASAAPQHNYSVRHGSSYGYTASSPDQGDGSAPDVRTFYVRYLGVRNGLYSLSVALTPGLPPARVQCANPCRFAKIGSGDYSYTMPLAANSNNIYAGAVQDAANGLLVQSK